MAPLGPAKINQALVEAREDAASRVGDNEKLIGDSVRIDGSGSPGWHDDSVMEFHYTYVVMVPGCSGWSKPLA